MNPHDQSWRMRHGLRWQGTRPTLGEALRQADGTLKSIIIVLAILVAYGIVGRMDYEDALLMEQVRPQTGADCIHPLEGDDTLPEGGPTGHPPVVRPIEGARPEAPCVPDAASDQPMRLTRH